MDLKYSQLDAAAELEVFVPYSRINDGLFGLTALALTASDAVALAPRFRQLVADVDRTQASDEVMVMERALAESIAPRRLHLFLLGTFAAPCSSR